MHGYKREVLLENIADIHIDCHVKWITFSGKQSGKALIITAIKRKCSTDQAIASSTPRIVPSFGSTFLDERYHYANSFVDTVG
jgi:hypothetical protein